MTTRTNKANQWVVWAATILLLITPLIEGTATVLLALSGLILLAFFSRKQLTQGSALAAVIGFAVALLIGLGILFWRR